MTDDKKKQVGAYKRTGVVTASREKILLMLYEGAIRFVKKAIDLNTQDKKDDGAYWAGRALDIVNELRATLNHKVDGDISGRLEELYGFIIGRLVEGSVQRKNEPLNEALGILNTLHDAWKEAIDSLQAPTSKVG